MGDAILLAKINQFLTGWMFIWRRPLVFLLPSIDLECHLLDLRLILEGLLGFSFTLHKRRQRSMKPFYKIANYKPSEAIFLASREAVLAEHSYKRLHIHSLFTAGTSKSIFKSVQNYKKHFFWNKYENHSSKRYPIKIPNFSCTLKHGERLGQVNESL